jgi:hypothetical protein
LNKLLLRSDVQDFIFENTNLDPTQVSLGKSPFQGVLPGELAGQVAARKKAQTKVPLWFAQKGIYYPPMINLEQASSEDTARYKASLLKGGDAFLDLTGGSGVDTYFIGEVFREVHYAERNRDLAEIAVHNFGVLGATHIVPHVGNGLELLENTHFGSLGWDWIYLDPSRRKKNRSKVFLLQDSEPPLPDALPLLFRASRNLLVKTSPMLDLSEGTRLMEYVREVHVVSVGNEVRELLWWLQEGYEGEADRVAVELREKDGALRFRASEEARAEVAYHAPMRYLYEPNAAILKAGAFKMASSRYGLGKIHPHTHLYTSDAFVDFPGRRFEILENLAYKPGKLPFDKANVSVRNFPDSVAALRKRNKIKDGGSIYLFFIRSLDAALRVLACRRM